MASDCLWCGGELIFWRYLTDSLFKLYDYPVEYGICKDCRSIEQINKLSIGELSKVYPESYWLSCKQESRSRSIALWYQKKVVALDQGRFVSRHFVSLKGKRILEIGPGRGDFLTWAKQQGALEEGWEQSSATVQYLKNQGLNAQSVVLENLSQWPEFEEPWDLIVGFHVLEHLLNPSEVAAGLLSRLAPGGMIIFQCPRADSWQSKIFQDKWLGLDAPRHVSIPTLAGIEKWTAKMNLEIISYEHFSLRDNASHVLLSLFPGLRPNRPNYKAPFWVVFFCGVWLFQPFAMVEALAKKGGTFMFSCKSVL